MTAQTRSTLKGVFEQGDIPQGSDFSDLIDSFLSLSDTGSQNVTSPVTFGGAVSFDGGVSAASLTVGGIVSANDVITSVLAAVTANITHLEVSGMDVSRVSAALVTAHEAQVSSLTVAVVNVSSLTISDLLAINVNTTATANPGTSAHTIPSTVAGYFEVSINGSPYRVPFFGV